MKSMDREPVQAESSEVKETISPIEMQRTLRALQERVNELEMQNEVLRQPQAEPDGEPVSRAVRSGIADRKRTEDAPMDNKELYRLITENINDLISIHDLDGKCTFLSSSCKKILGYEPKELIGVNPYDLFHADSVSLIQNVHNTILQSTESAVTSFRIRRKNGTYAWIETKIMAIMDTVTNKPTEILCISRDISSKKEEEELFLKMIEFAEELLRTGSEQVTYQKILDNLLYISKAKYGVLTLLNEKSGKFTSVAISGLKRTAKKVSSLLGFDLEGKVWNDYSSDNEVLKNQKVTRFSSMTELANRVIPASITHALESLLRIGETVVSKVTVNHQTIGDFTLIMPAKKKIENEYFVEIYTRQVDEFFARCKEEEILKASEERYRLISEHATDVTWVYNYTKGKITYISPSIFYMRGITAEEAMQERLEDSFTPESWALVADSLKTRIDLLQNDQQAFHYYVDEAVRPCKDGSTVTVEMSTQFSYNKNGEIEVLGVSRNIEERKRSEKEVLYLVYHDQLTGLYNRRFFEEEMNRLDTERNLPLTIAMGDVNGLKLINDSFGHAVGDELLKKIAEVIMKGCRADEIVARLGGDEFVILLPKTNAMEAEKIIQRIKELALLEAVGSFALSVSFGHQTKTEMKDDIQEVLKRTEDHMYRNKLSESSSMRSNTINLIMNTLFEKNIREMQHSKRVGEICQAIASKMNFDKEDIDQIRIAGLMHDIGKIGIDENILNKRNKLLAEEWNKIQKHSEIGYRILSSANEFSEIANYILEHHERWNGKGYPKGLSGEQISLQARIIAIADSFDAMTSERTYREVMTEDEAIQEIIRCSGIQFDPEIVRIFVEEVMGKT